MKIWNKMIAAAEAVQGRREVSPFVEAGGVAAAILTHRGNIYTGVCIDTACSLGMCAERAAIAAMITGGEQEICRVVALMSDGSAGMPCGACRELMMQLSPASGDILILADRDTLETVTLGDLMPRWWGHDRFGK